MTMVHERTRSVVESGEFLEALAKDKSLPVLIRHQAKRLLRHYPTAQEIWTAGRYENLRQQEIFRLAGTSMNLPPVLAIWPLCAPFFCDSNEQYGRGGRKIQHAVASGEESNVSKATNVPCATERGVLPRGVLTLTPVAIFECGCLTLRYFCFVSHQEQVLARASLIFGSRLSALQWLNKPARGLDRRPPCSLLSSGQGFVLVTNLLSRIDYGIY